MNNTKKPKEPVGFFWLATVLWLSVLLAQFLLERGGNPWLRAMGIACLLASPVFVFLPFFLLGRYGMPGDGKPYYHTSAVVDRGIYSIVRHPQYVGYVLFALGFAGLAQHALTWTLAAGSAAAFYIHSIREEMFCRERLGEDYSGYMQRVPRFNFLLGLQRLLRARSRAD